MTGRPGRRAIPGVGRLLAGEELAPLLAAHGRAEVTRATRSVLAALRSAIGRADAGDVALTPAALARRIAAELAVQQRPYYRRVINATGVVLHTNLGRAPLADEAVAALAALAGGAQRLEVDLETGQRGGRDEGCARLLRELTGAEAATVVNNNAAATVLVLAALGRGRRVVLSRGEMVEIGGSFRVPDIFAESGAVLHEVGTTNRTHPADYRRAVEEPVDPPVGLLLKVHTSNYRIEGFTAEVGIAELVALGRELGLPVVHDLGSGCLAGGSISPALADEPRVVESVAAGADIVCFSGDKLLGGPQAGILVGRREAIERCRRHPLYRALRPGRLVYTALEATLRLYRRGEEEALSALPVLARLSERPEAVQRRAERLAGELAGVAGVEAEVVTCASQAGSGSVPGRELPSRGVRLRTAGRAVGELAATLRSGDPSVVGRLQEDALLLDARTLAEGEVAEVAACVRAALAGGEPHDRFQATDSTASERSPAEATRRC